MLIDVKDANSGVSRTESELCGCVCEGAAEDTLWQVADQRDYISRLVVKDPHFILTGASCEDHILALVEHRRVDEGCNDGLVGSSLPRRGCRCFRTVFCTTFVLLDLRVIIFSLGVGDGRLTIRLGLLR